MLDQSASELHVTVNELEKRLDYVDNEGQATRCSYSNAVESHLVKVS